MRIFSTKGQHAIPRQSSIGAFYTSSRENSDVHQPQPSHTLSSSSTLRFEALTLAGGRLSPFMVEQLYRCASGKGGEYTQLVDAAPSTTAMHPHSPWRTRLHSPVRRDTWVSSWVLRQLALGSTQVTPTAISGAPPKEGEPPTASFDFVPAASVAELIPLLGGSPLTLCRRLMIPITTALRVIGPDDTFVTLRAAMKARADGREEFSPLWLPVELALSLHEYSPRIIPGKTITLLSPPMSSSTTPSREQCVNELVVVSAADVMLTQPEPWRGMKQSIFDSHSQQHQQQQPHSASSPWRVSLEVACMLSPQPIVYAAMSADSSPRGDTSSRMGSQLLYEVDVIRLQLAQRCRRLASPYWFTMHSYLSAAHHDKEEERGAVVAYLGQDEEEKEEARLLGELLNLFRVDVRLRDSSKSSVTALPGDDDDVVTLYNLDDIQRAVSHVAKHHRPSGETFTCETPRCSKGDEGIVPAAEPPAYQSGVHARVHQQEQHNAEASIPSAPCEEEGNTSIAPPPYSTTTPSNRPLHRNKAQQRMTMLLVPSDQLDVGEGGSRFILKSPCGSISIDLKQFGASLVNSS
ncbi:Hypothetical protein, putative [Bodo saltans]|uniref:Uncharacterized protein n=1 Tax=Bodo saltans TaxID=75058 RepID=A0A0S4IJY4_BODSA|nr:Hypothetical protein, putative [Bodo saltans]|eukprot:CUE97197.1 Hypothetical protein, putative [Bodo saltans]